jgi:uncharacterized membrane protein
MIEIIALVFLTKNIGALALQKGLKPGTWKLYTVLCWFGAELLGILIGLILFGEEYIFVAIVLGLGSAIAGYFILKSTLNKKPDIEDDIDKIGVSDLYPGKN